MRRLRGDGGITKRKDGRWQASYVGLDGRRHYLYAQTRRLAADRLGEAIRDRDLGLDGSRQTVGEYLARWLPRARVKDITLRRYESLIRLHAAPIAAIPLRRLTPPHLADLYASLEGRQSASSIGQLHAVLHSALRQAVAWQQIPRNPADAVRPPKIVKAPFPGLPDPRVLLEAVRGDWFEHLYVLAVSTGARQGELLGLTWADVDLDGRTIRIDKTLVRLKGRWAWTLPKTAKSVRTIPLTSHGVAALRAQRRAMTDFLQGLHRLPTGDVPVFLTQLGDPVNGFHLTERHYKPLLRRAGLPPSRFHDLRHLAATLMLRNGVPVHVVSSMLGHSSPAVTLGVYAHLIPGDMEAAVAAIERELAG